MDVNIILVGEGVKGFYWKAKGLLAIKTRQVKSQDMNVVCR